MTRVLLSITVPLLARCVHLILMSFTGKSLLLRSTNLASMTLSNPPLFQEKSTSSTFSSGVFSGGGGGAEEEDDDELFPPCATRPMMKSSRPTPSTTAQPATRQLVFLFFA